MLALVIEASEPVLSSSNSAAHSHQKNRQIDARFRLDAKWLENRREFAEIGTEHPLAELKICSWSSSFFVDSCLFWAWLLHKIRLLDPHLYRNTLSLLLNTLVGQTPEILLKFVHHIALNVALNLLYVRKWIKMK